MKDKPTHISNQKQPMPGSEEKMHPQATKSSLKIFKNR